MKQEYEEKLHKDFPLLYADKDKSPEESLICFGFECGDGWYTLLRNLSAKLESAIMRHIQENPTDEYRPRAVQVKEKFGGLRFYMTSETPEISDFIRAAERKSYETCEACGEVGTTGGKGWISTLCEKCRGKQK